MDVARAEVTQKGVEFTPTFASRTLGNGINNYYWAQQVKVATNLYQIKNDELDPNVAAKVGEWEWDGVRGAKERLGFPKYYRNQTATVGEKTAYVEMTDTPSRGAVSVPVKQVNGDYKDGKAIIPSRRQPC